ncbi:MAG: hypothetical protein JWO38_1319 [Gemmataceae bacterium]|nr:hypothetical protein [Gemmataceae bacterium]
MSEATNPPDPDHLRTVLLGGGTAEERAAVTAYLAAYPDTLATPGPDPGNDPLVAELLAAPGLFALEPEFWRGLRQARALPAGPGAGELVGGRVGRYRILAPLGRGGTGGVYRAEDATGGQPVALKLLPPGGSADPFAAERVRREREWLARLDHPNVVRLLDAGEEAGSPFFVMELLDGLDLSRLAGLSGPLPVPEACELARQAAEGLEHARGRGLVHRDVKPSNLLLTRDGVVKVLDLGLARSGPPDGDAVSLTGSDQLLGTLDYMAPEQALDTRAADARADVYGLGCTLYRLLAGRPPFGGPEYRNPLRKALAHVREPVPPLGDLRPDLPAGLDGIVGRMLAKDPGERFPTPGAVAVALAPFATGADPTGLARRFTPPAGVTEGSTTACQPTTREPTGRPSWIKRRPRLLVMIVAAAMGLLAAMAGWDRRPAAGDTDRSDEAGAAPAPAPTADPPLNTPPGGGRWVVAPNGDFEAEAPGGWPAGWPPQMPAHAGAWGRFVRSTRMAVSGRASAEVVALRDLPGPRGFAHITDEQQVTPGRRYILSGWFDTTEMPDGNLYLDLAQTGFNVIVMATPGKPWHFAWKEFTPDGEWVRIRLVRDRAVKAGERAYVDCVGLTPADEFAPPAPGE